MSFKVGDRVTWYYTLEDKDVVGTVLEVGHDGSSYLIREDSTKEKFHIHKGHLRPESDMVNHPAHYTGHPTVEAIEVLEQMSDYRLASASKYIWRVAFGGKENNRQDIEKSVWYLQRWLEKQSDV